MRSSETLPSSTCNPWKLLLASMPGIASGELMTAIAMTQPGTGSDLAGIRTTATRDGDHYVLNGAKTFITGGLNAPAGSALAVHAARLTSVAERQAVARALRRAVRDATDTRATRSGRVPMHRANIASAEASIDDVTRRLHAPEPVSTRGMARLRQLLFTGTSALYRHGRGDLQNYPTLLVRGLRRLFMSARLRFAVSRTFSSR